MFVFHWMYNDVRRREHWWCLFIPALFVTLLFESPIVSFLSKFNEDPHFVDVSNSQSVFDAFIKLIKICGKIIFHAHLHQPGGGLLKYSAGAFKLVTQGSCQIIIIRFFRVVFTFFVFIVREFHLYIKRCCDKYQNDFSKCIKSLNVFDMIIIIYP